MASATSNVFSVLVSPAATSIWSDENVPGSFDAASDTWTPGRGSDGRVTKASWALVPFDRWVRVAGTRMDALGAVVAAAMPNWADRGTQGWNGVLKAWSGMAVDASRPRAFFFGGGHHDSSNNGVYRLDLNKMSWAVEKLPTDSTKFDSRYNTSQNGSFTVYPPAQEYQTAHPNDTSVLYDCFYPFAPNEPTARHTYGSLVYNPQRNELFMGCRRMWLLSLDSGQWSVTNQRAALGATSEAGENMFAWWDRFRGRYVINATQNGNAGRNFEFDPATRTCAWSSVNLRAADYYWATAACEHDGVIYAYCRPDSQRTAELQVLDIQSNVATVKAITGVSNDTYSGDFYDGGSLTYVPERQKLLSASLSVALKTMRLYWIDPGSGVMSVASEPGNLYPSPAAYVETKMQYISQLRAVVYIDSADNDLRVMRVG
ncbi:hypothetical protein GCM10025771_03100 [Niveibacterium umoris]|uniref:Uncharacterized protein n=1 Tax=Niveibacterium umoris TaxID=1193620 RepID=A0A840BRI8_9RHOO|nr:hypothetical protein [Niveibacterium umoris]MBB4014148.1 hypothetical protein [Niveibacterium umoris]